MWVTFLITLVVILSIALQIYQAVNNPESGIYVAAMRQKGEAEQRENEERRKREEAERMREEAEEEIKRLKAQLAAK
jgi:uncharacterized protein HemX